MGLAAAEKVVLSPNWLWPRKGPRIALNGLSKQPGAVQSPASAPTTSPASSRRPPGSPPHQDVLAHRVERAKQLLQGDGDLSLGQVAARTGFSDQSHFSHHFKRLVGVTPGRFRMRTRIS